MQAVHRRFALLGVVFAIACGQPFQAGGGAGGSGGEGAGSASSGTGGDAVSSSSGGGSGGGTSVATASATTDASVTASATTSGVGGAGTTSAGTGGAGTSTGAGGGSDSGGAGPGGCLSPSDCPPSVTVCQTPACIGGACGLIAVDGSPFQTSGDCKVVVCDNGSEATHAAPDDFADDGLPCTVDGCDGTTVKHTPKSLGTPCPGGICGAGGACVQCLVDLDCGVSQGCTGPICVNGTCQNGFKAAGILCNNQEDQCDGQGNCVDCVNSGGCGECCICTVQHTCVPA